MKKIITLASIIILFGINSSYCYYTTQGKYIVDRKTGEKVILRGIGLGCWLLPEGYMWGIRKLDRPWQFEQAIEELIGEKNAAEFWRIYHENFVTEGDIKAMKEMGLNSVRIALLASKLQPREGQPAEPPYVYSEEGFRFLDSIVTWCSKYEMGIIWDMHGAPGGQNAENISDSDGEARLWTEKEKYWPLCNDLWYKIAERYKGEECIVGYDLLNEPLLIRYEGIPTDLLREFYVLLTNTIRKVDKEGIIFIEGDDWAQNFSMLEPMDWDPHLVIAFHSYPPASGQKGLQRWDDLRNKYNIPLWHGETGEQGPPYEVNIKSTKFLETADVGWAWWTHKKFERYTQLWVCYRTEGFAKILDYWRGIGEKPSGEKAKEWLFEQARLTNTDYCEFLPEMVRSLVPLNPDKYLSNLDTIAPEIISQTGNVEIEVGSSEFLEVKAIGYPKSYQWSKNGKVLKDETDSKLKLENFSTGVNPSKYMVTVYNSEGKNVSKEIMVNVKPFSGPVVAKVSEAPVIDGKVDNIWDKAQSQIINNIVIGELPIQSDLKAEYKVLYDANILYVLIIVTDDIKKKNNPSDYMNDGIEIYIDHDNNKPEFYSEKEFMFRYIWSEENIRTVKGKAGKGIQSAQADTPEGYIMEVAFPWEAIGGKCSSCNFIGFDVHVNDNDKNRRQNKLTWYSKRDNAYISPMAFGTLSR